MSNLKFTRNLRSNYKWTPKQDATLRALFSASLSGEAMAKTINEQFGTHYTSKAARSRCGTLGLRRCGRRPVVVWSDARNLELRHRVTARERYADIARAMNVKHSAVVAQIVRLQIKRPLKPKPEPALDEAASRSAAQQDRQLRERLNRMFNVVPEEFLAPELVEPRPDPVTNPRNLTLAEIGNQECRWITNDDMADARYCGHSTLGGSWCAAHWAFARRDYGDEAGQLRERAVAGSSDRGEPAVTGAV